MAISISFRLLVIYVLGVGLVSTIPCASGANFLTGLFNPLGQASHIHFVGRITAGLIKRGHTVTLLVADTYDLHSLDKDNAVTRILTFKTTTSSSDSGLKVFSESMSATQQNDASSIGTLQIFLALRDVSSQNCADMFNDQVVMNEIRKNNFDLLLLEMFVPCDALLAEYLKVPFIAMTSTLRFPAFDEDFFNMEIPSSYVPFESMGALTDEMNFAQRVQNFLDRHVIAKVVQYLNMRPYRKIQLEYKIDTTSSIRELTGRAQLWLCHMDFALDFPRPTAPNWKMIAGLTVDAGTKPLSQDLEAFVEGSGDHGVIVFSLGSTDVSLLTEQMNEDFAQALSELPQRVLWKYDGLPPRNLGNNTRLMSWLPQRDLLAHPKTKLLIYHGGLAGVYEAMHLQKPMVILPVFADQPAIAARVAKKGMGVVLSRATLSAEIINQRSCKSLPIQVIKPTLRNSDPSVRIQSSAHWRPPCFG
ncbi:UDP-glucuronosyltransferase 1-2 [Strongylocentrotus purpuratus]|uniref:UDP-glucuronosyltransferase n=1 Tax=Strongylocentrotus purpuratus TaxID=7668 RepID=A0A7M7RIE8_STRPU|nr:UDP-glucuronosyltransferase 1-2 [Strongylocentrotus purpuratus]